MAVKSPFQDAAMPAGLAALMSRADAGDKAPPPVEKWNPPFCGDLDIRIARDGTWFYLGSPIGRLPLVKLFASVLRRDEDGKHYLVTPVEKIGITVEDAPLLAVEMAAGGEAETQQLTLRTNLGDLVKVGAEHPLRFEKEPDSGGLKPYVHVRGRLEALFTRALMYQLADLMEHRGDDMGVWSGGVFFAVSPDLLTAPE
ncbi:DUF1285 domain-containing protein [Roseibium sediminicola]|uniref:DUF1285 domain-containing protein n=1 Tax=Roseibium sediminicola TaxID=2933272 RepID=A0ABT0H3U3_9HYPH|nr:DUF1285 domain-containing protein [Roseibium sp. CAU 1639]MCK7615775.1 DUF1285 domain-containing protein [Roseibium sp. CAU 1639]